MHSRASLPAEYSLGSVNLLFKIYASQIIHDYISPWASAVIEIIRSQILRKVKNGKHSQCTYDFRQEETVQDQNDSGGTEDKPWV